jgi:hypothetical protein
VFRRFSGLFAGVLSKLDNSRQFGGDWCYLKAVVRVYPSAETRCFSYGLPGLFLVSFNYGN